MEGLIFEILRHVLKFLGFPAIMVIISLSVTQLKRYGHKEACWLNADEGLIWAFIVPALGVILVSKKNTFNVSCLIMPNPGADLG